MYIGDNNNMPSKSHVIALLTLSRLGVGWKLARSDFKCLYVKNHC